MFAARATRMTGSTPASRTLTLVPIVTSAQQTRATIANGTPGPTKRVARQFAPTRNPTVRMPIGRHGAVPASG
jgi:hypothetical protein